MYDWLAEELAAVKTRKFFLVAPQSETETGEPMNISSFPSSFREFLRRFGKTQFFRDSTGCYAIGIFATPEKTVADDERYWRIGWYRECSVLLKELPKAWRGEWPVFEESKYGKLRRVSESFEDWLSMRWQKWKATYSARQWQKIAEGPPPFTTDELKIIEAHQRFRWKLVLIDDDCTLHFEIRNDSDRRLPYIGVTAHGKYRGVWVGLAIRVDHIEPGQSAVVQHKGMQPLGVTPDEIEILEDEEPGPEDRDFFWAFRPMPER